jgi:heptosyltransferase-2
MRIVVFCPNLIGDTVMATPTLRALRRAYPDATIHGVVKPHVAPTLDGAPWLDDRILFNPRADDVEHKTWTVINRLRDEQYDLAVLLPNSFRSTMLAWLGTAKRRIGYARGGRSWMLTDRLEPPRDADGKFTPTPIVEYYLKIVRALGVPVESTKLELFTTADDEQAASAAFHDLGIAGDRPLIGLNTGGAFGPAKNWPVGHFVEVARRLADERDAEVLILCGPSERDTAREIVRRTERPQVVSLADQPMSLGLTKACVRRLSLLITTDSGPRHFAAAFGVPVLSLFGPTHIAWTRTYYPQAIHMRFPVPCGPCQQPVCPEGHHRCMTELSPASVFAAATRLLGQRQSVSV